ncbi:Smr/MutS family protein [Roseomonas terrae]|jgi:DNA-nicking Smr family endonuclease|uniref:Smr/MutS family protein n=1 Tax=Neoroseomonas terrae TaxID=424799 RepID=A0ABS5EFH1_9PROT|nr:Smr/MutS family protein [Neoroseomonas terrae]MBR0649768.1 Smr/MutS family protein [Neoroseomonas terrae]
MTRRRLRGLSEADRALWRAFAAEIVPLPGRELPPEVAAPVAAPPALPAAASLAPSPPSPRWTPPPDIAVNAPPAGLDDRRWRDLRRGRIRPERTIDLHGRRAQEAHAAVHAFLAEAYADGVRCVSVITGRGSTTEGGVLRRELPHWLNAPDLRRIILGAAHPHRANTGSVHLLLRRRR